MSRESRFDIAEALKSMALKMIYGCGVSDCKNERPRGMKIDGRCRCSGFGKDLREIAALINDVYNPIQEDQMKYYKDINYPTGEPFTEQGILELVNRWCQESLSPENFEKWEDVVKGLIIARKDLSEFAAPNPPITGPSGSGASTCWAAICPACDKPIEEGNMSSTGYIDYHKGCNGVQ